MRILHQLYRLLSAVYVHSVRRVVWPEDKGSEVPPIRYDGDPTEIYLA